MLYDQLLKQRKFLSKEISAITQKLSSYPEGDLICTKNGKYFTYLHSLKGNYHYIPKKNSSFIQKMSEKKLLAASLEDLTNELQSVEAFLTKYKSYSKVEQLLRHPSYQHLFLQAFPSASEDLEQWKKEAYQQNSLHPENLLHSCPSGHIVRSKSEALIDQALFLHGLPFRYECALNLGDGTFYPDFTILHPDTKEIIYWEHFGIMDSPSYSQNAFQKLNTYCKNGIIPTINLITTHETKDHPLTSKTVEDLIQQFFYNT